MFVDLLTRNLLAVLDDIRAAIDTDPECARPEHLCPRLIHGAVARPLVRAMHTRDDDLLGALLDDPRSHDLARTDWDIERQT